MSAPKLRCRNCGAWDSLNPLVREPTCRCCQTARDFEAPDKVVEFDIVETLLGGSEYAQKQIRKALKTDRRYWITEIGNRVEFHDAEMGYLDIACEGSLTQIFEWIARDAVEVAKIISDVAISDLITHLSPVER